MLRKPSVSLDKSASGGGTAARVDKLAHQQIKTRRGRDRFIGDNCYGESKMAIQGSKTKPPRYLGGCGVRNIIIGKMSLVTSAATSKSHPYFFPFLAVV